MSSRGAPRRTTLARYVATKLHAGGEQPAALGAGGGHSHLCLADPAGRDAQARLDGVAGGAGRGRAGGRGGLRHAFREAVRRRHLRRGVRPFAHRLCGLRRHPAVSRDAGERQVRPAQGFHRPHHRRSASTGAADRFRVRRVHRRRHRIRHPGGGGRRHAGGPGIRAVPRRRHLPAGEYRGGGLRRHRNSGGHPGGHHRPAARPSQRGGGPHLHARLSVCPGLPDSGDVRPQGPARRPSRRGGLRRLLHHRAVAGFEFRSGAAHRGSGGHSRSGLAGGSASRVEAAR